MSEKIPSFETKVELIPSEEEITSVFEALVEGKEYETRRKRNDEKGVYLWEIELKDEAEDGGTVEYSYSRAGVYPENKSTETVVHVTYFDADGVPQGGHSVALYKNGKWTME